jgi:hypothetical protein
MAPDRDAVRERWLDLQQKHADFSRRQLAILLPKERLWLYRNDKEWLEAHSPPPQRMKGPDKRVNWVVVDCTVAIRLREVALQIMREVPPRRVTLAALERGLGRPDWLARRKTKLPKCKKVLEEVIEQIDPYQFRRVGWAIEALKLKGLPVQAWRVCRLAGLPRDALPTVGEVIAHINFENGGHNKSSA